MAKLMFLKKNEKKQAQKYWYRNRLKVYKLIIFLLIMSNLYLLTNKLM